MSPDVSASVRARLLDKAKARREEFERTLTRFAAERWLYRLGVSPVRERCILKGASLVAAWVPEPYRVTRDIDMLARGPADEPAIRGLVETVCAVPCPEDGLTFDLSKLTLEPIRAEDEYVGTRARFVALLSNARIRVQLDFGVGDALTATPGEIDLPTLLDTLQMPHQNFLLLVLQDEATRRDGQATTLRAQKAQLDPNAQLEAWDPTAKVTLDHALLNELAALRFLDTHHNVLIVGPVGVGKTFLAHALGHIACRRGHSVLAQPVDKVLRTMRHARLTNSHEQELRRFLGVDLLILDDFCIDTMDGQESRDAYEILTERHRAGSVIVTSNRGPDEWLATFADPVRAQSAIDRFANNAFDLVIDGESYRSRLKPTLGRIA